MTSEDFLDDVIRLRREKTCYRKLNQCITKVGEMGLVRRGQKVPSRKILVGVPAKVVGDVDEDRLKTHKWAKDLYIDLARRCLGGAIEKI